MSRLVESRRLQHHSTNIFHLSAKASLMFFPPLVLHLSNANIRVKLQNPKHIYIQGYRKNVATSRPAVYVSINAHF